MGEHPSVASFWMGSSLGVCEHLCLKSFWANGHDVVLYTYGDVRGVPDGVCIEDAAQFVPLVTAERYANDSVLQSLADRFRYVMLREADHIWVDTDMLALRPMSFADNLFGRFKNHPDLINNAVLRLPKSSPVLDYLIALTDNYHPMVPGDWPFGRKFFAGGNPTGEPIDLPSDQFSFGELPFYFAGPHALTHALTKFGGGASAQPADVFYPFDARLLARNTKAPFRHPLVVPEATEAVHHVGGRVLRKIASDENGRLMIHRKSLIGEACRTFAVSPGDWQARFVSKHENERSDDGTVSR